MVFVILSMMINACQPKPVVPATESPPPAEQPTPTNAGIQAVDDGAPLVPEIIEQDPARGMELALSGEISLTFSLPMDTEKTSAAWEMKGPAEKVIEGEISWISDREMRFAPNSPLEPASLYSIVVSTDAASEEGVNLVEPVLLEFITSGELEVSQVFPTPDTKDVSNDAVITVIFNRPVVPLVISEEESKLPQPVSITPTTPGKGAWVNTSIYAFQSDEPLIGDTTYSITVQAGLEDAVEETQLAADYSWSFTTAAPGIESLELGSGVVNPEDNYKNLLLDEYFRLHFLQPMDPQSTESSLALIDDQGESAELINQWSQDFTQLVITPTERLELGTQYSLNLDQAALASDGGALKSGLVWNFTTVPAPSIISISPANNTVQENYSTELRIQFASPMNIDTVKERILVTPQPDDDIEWWYQEWDYSFASYILSPSTRYTVQFLPGMEDIYGNKIEQGMTARFTTAAQPPSAYLQMPYEPILMRPDGPQDFYAYYRNAQSISLQIYEITAEQMVSFMTGDQSAYEYMPSEATRIWQQEEDSSASLNVPVLNSFTPLTSGGEPLPAGFYFLGMDAEGVQKYNPWVDNRLLIVANANLTFKTTSTDTLVWLTDLTSGRPVARAGIGIYDNEMRLVGEGITDQDGILALEVPSPEEPYDARFAISSSGEVFAFATSQGDSGVEMWQYGNFGGYFAPANQPTAYVYTERPIYRPGQPVYFKGIVRNDDDLDYSIPDTQSIKVKISSFEESIFEEDLTLSDMGTFDGELQLDTEAALGYYTLEVFYPERELSIGTVGFTVAEYRRPEFMVTVSAAPTNVLAGEEFVATVQADYYSGGVVSEADVTWTLTSQRFTFSPPDEYSNFSFSDSDIDVEAFGDENDQESKVIAQGTGNSDANGRFRITLPADLSDSKTSLVFIFEATVTDLSNNAVSSRTQVTGHRSQVYPGAKPQNYVGQAGEEEFFEFVSLDWNGEIVSNQSLDIEIVERRWYSVQEQDPSGRIQWKSTVEDIPVANFTGILTDSDGKAVVGYTPPNGGIFRARVSTIDTKSNLSTASAYMWVAGGEYIPWQQTNDRSFDLVTDRKDYSPGDTAEILIASPFQGEAYALVTVERGRIHYEDVVRLTSNSTVYKLPVSASMAPNAFVSVLVIKGIDETNPRPNFKLGIVEIGVDRYQQETTVVLEANPKEASPGDVVTYKISTLDFQGDPVSSEVSLGLSDLATLSLLPPNSVPIMDHFYSNRTLGVWTVVPIDASIEEYNALITDEIVQGGQGGGGGGKGVGDQGVMEVRQDFPDTAFWAAYIKTNAEGQATVNITLPDNLTTWRMDARAVNEDTLVGQSTLDLVSTKSLLVRPQTPRFFVSGDRAVLGAAVHNNTDNPLQVEVTLEGEGLKLEDPAIQSIQVPAKAQAYTSWNAVIETDVDRVDLVFSAKSGELTDASRPPQGILDNQGIPVYRFSAPEHVGTSGQILDEGTQVEAINLPSGIDDTQGDLTVKINPSLAAGIFDGLSYLESYPYECIEQTISRFLPSVITTRALQEAGISDPSLEQNLDDLVETSLQRLYNWQNPDGGWGWWQNEKSDALTSAYVVLGLVEAQAAGYTVSENVIKNGLNYLTSQLKPVVRLTSPELLNRQAFLLYVLARADRPAISSTTQIYDQRQNLATYALAFLTQTLAWIDNEDPRISTLLSDLNSSAITSASGTHWEETEADRWNWNTDTRSTAIVLSVLSILDPENPVIANAARWLTSHRRDDHWLGTQETAWTLMALTNWMVASGELEAEYLYGVTLNGENLGGGEANADNLKESVEFTVPVAELIRDEANRLAIARDAGPGNLYYTAHLNVYLPVEDIAPLDQGITVSRSYFKLDDLETPIEQANLGELILARLTLVVPQAVHYVMVDDPLPAGLEAVDQSLSTSPQSIEIPQEYTQEDLFWRGWGWWYFTHVQFRDEKVQLSTSYLPAGTYIYTYLVRAFTVGEFNTIPPTAQEFYFPEVSGRGSGSSFTVLP